MLRITITSPEQCFLDQEATSVILPGKEGEFEVQKGHIACLSLLTTGSILVKTANGDSETFFVDGGVVEVSRDEVAVLVDSAHHARLSEQEKLESEQRQLRRDLGQDTVNHNVLLKQLAVLAAELRTIQRARSKKK